MSRAIVRTQTFSAILLVVMTWCCVQHAQTQQKSPPGKAERVTYEVSFTTGNKPGSGTDADIYLTLYGKKGQEGEIRINPFFPGHPFQAGKTDAMKMALQDIGEITKITVRSDANRVGADWFLRYVTVKGPADGGNTFDFESWFKDKIPQTRTKAPR